MPHLVILYTGNLDAVTNMSALCRAMADAMLSVRDETGKPVFPTGGVRVLAYPAPHFAVADGGAAGQAAGLGDDYGFVYLNLRMARGRSAAVQQQAGQTLAAVAKAHFAPLLAARPVGITLQIDEGPEVFDAKNSSLHPLFAPTAAPTSAPKA
jgi:5-carboxymethyl-2-hydroxymuconate isomerase